MRYLLSAVVIFGILLFSCSGNQTNRTQDSVSYDGATLFAVNCSSCHKCDEDFQGPKLKSALQRWPGKKEMYSFIRDPWGTIQKNDYAKKLQEKYNVVMTPSTLSDQELDAIFDYCEKSTAK